MRLIHKFAVMLAGLALPHAAIAHPGHHGGLTPEAMADHFWTSPFHVLPLVVGGLALAGLVLGLHKAGRLPTRKNRTADAAKPGPSQVRQADDTSNDSKR